MSEYLRTNRSELASKELNTPEELEQPILSGSTVQLDGSSDRRAGIRSRTARKWLNRLGYKWKEVQKGVFFDGHEQKDMVEYKERFLSEMKSLLPYFVEFSEDGSMLPKIYPEDCIVSGLDRRPVTMITCNESTFSANDRCRKVLSLDGHDIL